MGGALQRIDGALDLGGGGLCAFGEHPHLVGYHGEAASLFAGAGRLYRGIQCQQVGLLGNALNGGQHTGDVIGMTAELGDDLSGRADLVGQAGDGAAGLVDQIASVDAAVARLLCRRPCCALTF